MIVKVLSVDDRSGYLRAELLGSVFTARWHGNSLPDIKEYHCELDCEPIDWSSERTRILHDADLELQEVGVNVVRSQVVEIDSHGVVRLRTLGEEFLVDSIGDPPSETAGTTVEFALEDLVLFPYEL